MNFLFHTWHQQLAVAIVTYIRFKDAYRLCRGRMVIEGPWRASFFFGAIFLVAIPADLEAIVTYSIVIVLLFLVIDSGVNRSLLVQNATLATVRTAILMELQNQGIKPRLHEHTISILDPYSEDFVLAPATRGVRVTWAGTAPRFSRYLLLWRFGVRLRSYRGVQDFRNGSLILLNSILFASLLEWLSYHWLKDSGQLKY